MTAAEAVFEWPTETKIVHTRCERTCLGEKVQSVWPKLSRLEKPALGLV